LVTKNKL